jgi:nucleoside-diphosphate-sugar epimerase
LAAYHEKAPGNIYNISNDHPLTQQELFNAVADEVDGKRPTRRLPYVPLYYGSMFAERVAHLTHTRPVVTRLGVMMFGTDNRHSIEKARSELGYEPQVEIREGIRLAAAWFNAGDIEQPVVAQASQYTPLRGARKS